MVQLLLGLQVRVEYVDPHAELRVLIWFVIR
jgi:hypothetical protein